MTDAAKLSVCLITRDEEQRLPAALESVSEVADEVVVVDSGSRDRTRELAAGAGAVVVEHQWRGFGAQRNVALDHASGDWVLELDADERCTPELAHEIRQFLAARPSPEITMGVIPMRQRFLGRLLGPAGHYPFYRMRLFRHGAYRHDESRPVHEGLWPRERPWVFTHDLHHELAGSLTEALRDASAYAWLEAAGISAVSAQALLTGTLGRPPLKFLYQTIVMGGWRDGYQGVVRSAIECLGDALTWLRAGRRGQWRALDAPGHFGRSLPRSGPIHLLAVGDPSGVRAWLGDAVASGAWISVVCSARHATEALAGGEPLRVRTVSHAGPFTLARAIDAEAQLSPVDAWLALDQIGDTVLRALPFATPVIDPRAAAASEVVGEAQRARGAS